MFYTRLQIKRPKTHDNPLSLSLNRVLAEDVVAEVDLPRFNRSAVDGYAVKAEATVGATQFKPKKLKLTDKGFLDAKHTKRVWTGNALPRGADAVVMLENTKEVEAEVEAWVPVTPGENVCKRGEDIRKGRTAVEAGTRLRPQHLGLIAALGFDEVCVFELPKIAILATGNELEALGSRLQKNQVFDVNRLVLASLCRELGVEPIDLGIAKDSIAEIATKLRTGLQRADAIITSGGTSVGGSDLVPDAVNNIGKPGVIVHGVAMRPAMPTALAVVKEKPVLILPGNPAAAMISFEVFARPLICRMLALRQAEPRFEVQAKMNKGIATSLGRRNFVRVNVFRKDGGLFAEPISARGSSMISTMTRANGYVVVPESREGLEQGECVTVQLFDFVKVAD
jgi:molybdopterin molybdotransferase